MPNLEVGGRTFRDIDSYRAAKRDFENIEAIKERHDMTKYEDVLKIRDNIENGNYRFETMLGDDFLDELEEALAQLERDKALSQPQRKGFKPFKKKTAKDDPDIMDPGRIFDDEDDYDPELEEEINRQIKKRERRKQI